MQRRHSILIIPLLCAIFLPLPDVIYLSTSTFPTRLLTSHSSTREPPTPTSTSPSLANSTSLFRSFSSRSTLPLSMGRAPSLATLPTRPLPRSRSLERPFTGVSSSYHFLRPSQSSSATTSRRTSASTYSGTRTKFVLRFLHQLVSLPRRLRRLHLLLTSTQAGSTRSTTNLPTLL